ncbi:MAG: hypothetical protein LBR38_06285 [Synergistaceae bacterium]|nr:hypothetical protein [Synergistaceae bacterium]
MRVSRVLVLALTTALFTYSTADAATSEYIETFNLALRDDQGQILPNLSPGDTVLIRPREVLQIVVRPMTWGESDLNVVEESFPIDVQTPRNAIVIYSPSDTTFYVMSNGLVSGPAVLAIEYTAVGSDASTATATATWRSAEFPIRFAPNLDNDSGGCGGGSGCGVGHMGFFAAALCALWCTIRSTRGS